MQQKTSSVIPVSCGSIGVVVLSLSVSCYVYVGLPDGVMKVWSLGIHVGSLGSLEVGLAHEKPKCGEMFGNMRGSNMTVQQFLLYDELEWILPGVTDVCFSIWCRFLCVQ